MEDLLSIYVDRLSGQKEEKLAFSLSPKALSLNSEITLKAPVVVKGKVYTASDFLIVNAHLSTQIETNCHICSKPVVKNIEVANYYFTKPLEEIPHKIFSLAPIFREAIVLQLPSVVECQVSCPGRDHLKKYMGSKEPQEGFFPFESL